MGRCGGFMVVKLFEKIILFHEKNNPIYVEKLIQFQISSCSLCSFYTENVVNFLTNQVFTGCSCS